MLFLAEKEPVSGKTGLSGCSLSGNVHGKAHPGTGVSVLPGTGQVAVPVALLWATEPAPVLPPLAGAEPKFLALSLKKKGYQFLISSLSPLKRSLDVYSSQVGAWQPLIDENVKNNIFS